MVNYELAKIYKIVCNITGLIYIGSTCEPTLAKRLAKHRIDYKRFLNGSKIYLTSYKVLENNDYDIILIENVVCENKDELHKKERFNIENYECVNKNIPSRTYQEYCNDNKVMIAEKRKILYDQSNKDIYKQYYIDHKDKRKEYIEINKHKIAEKKKIYREKKQSFN